MLIQKAPILWTNVLKSLACQYRLHNLCRRAFVHSHVRLRRPRKWFRVLTSSKGIPYYTNCKRSRSPKQTHTPPYKHLQRWKKKLVNVLRKFSWLSFCPLAPDVDLLSNQHTYDYVIFQGHVPKSPGSASQSVAYQISRTMPFTFRSWKEETVLDYNWLVRIPGPTSSCSGHDFLPRSGTTLSVWNWRILFNQIFSFACQKTGCMQYCHASNRTANFGSLVKEVC